MSALDDFAALVESTEMMKQVLRELIAEPAHILGDVCREHEKTGQPVPDHRVHFTGYLGETAVRALVAAGLMKQNPGGRLSIYSYEPTPKGMEQYLKLKAERFYEKNA